MITRRLCWHGSVFWYFTWVMWGLGRNVHAPLRCCCCNLIAISTQSDHKRKVNWYCQQQLDLKTQLFYFLPLFSFTGGGEEWIRGSRLTASHTPISASSDKWRWKGNADSIRTHGAIPFFSIKKAHRSRSLSPIHNGHHFIALVFLCGTDVIKFDLLTFIIHQTVVDR